jgi:hypothetical protein
MRNALTDDEVKALGKEIPHPEWDKSPIVEYENGFVFWDETWANAYGPFNTLSGAQLGLLAYAIDEL